MASEYLEDIRLLGKLERRIGNPFDTIFLVLLIVFVVLKLTDLITWSWVWVLSPIWGGFIFNLIFRFFVVLYYRHKYEV